MASAVKLTTISPNENIISSDSAMNSGNGRICNFTAISTIAATAT